ncbi:hypothetical protein K461DRAFT_322737 [Myriangium duriaei CBS 260.36]|uniref:Uncharacterized protein n=1 Tax=Myriangium duriaei CBS 260.36 TaxID=1168546 RepID=A0A9P4MIX1_9PEZI|nr:hypothetical protein K461DRAFT_322737 [Myriangium duriaei CBS 260.36]
MQFSTVVFALIMGLSALAYAIPLPNANGDGNVGKEEFEKFHVVQGDKGVKDPAPGVVGVFEVK